MKVLQDLLQINEAISYDNDTKKLSGTTKEWLTAIGATKDDVAEAYENAKELPSYEALTSITDDMTTATQKKNGTFKFGRLDGVKGSYEVYANGQIRLSSFNDGAGWGGTDANEPQQTKLVSPKPRLKHGDVATSLKMIYDGAFKELNKKLEKVQKQAAKVKAAAK